MRVVERQMIQIRPIPRCEPPADDEAAEGPVVGPALVGAPAVGAPALPITFPGGSRRSGRRSPTATLIAAPSPDVEASPARAAIRRFLAAYLEVLGGFRPASQLRQFCRPDRFGEIVGQVTGRASGRAARFRGQAHAQARQPFVARPPTGAPPRAGRVSPTGPTDRVTVRRVRVSEAISDVAEVAVVLASRDQVWAVALRLECTRGEWLCTHFETI